MPKVLIVGGDHLIEDMFRKRGWEIVSSTGAEPDLVQFTGGADVSPAFYHEAKHPASHTDPRRDEYEFGIFHQYIHKPKAGICRGGQFLNVMCGGKMWQHVDNHTRSHKALSYLHGTVVDVTSTHHQMMRPSEAANILMVADPRVSTYKQSATETSVSQDLDIEACFYDKALALCYQPHPEYTHFESECQNVYFDYLSTFLNLRKG